jgi:TonB family protein
VNDPVDRLIVERAAMDAGFSSGIGVSVAAHVVVLALVFLGRWLFPQGPPIKVADGFAVVLPRGGGGVPAAAPPAPAKPAPESVTPPAPAPVEKPPDVIKPPKEPPPKNRLPEPNAPRSKNKKPEKEPPVTGARPRGVDEKAPVGGTRGGSGTASQTPGLSIGPPGPGVPDGTDTGGDWYLASVQQKIYMVWTQQIKTGFTQPIGVSFTIQADGSVADVRITQSSGATLLDLAAQRSIYSAAPFAPLPKDYGTNRKTIEAIFRPVS